MGFSDYIDISSFTGLIVISIVGYIGIYILTLILAPLVDSQTDIRKKTI